MKNSFWGLAFFISMAFDCYGQITAYSEAPFYRVALVRGLSSSFEDSLKLNPPPSPIDLDLAVEQHENYVHVLENLVCEVVRIKTL